MRTSRGAMIPQKAARKTGHRQLKRPSPSNGHRSSPRKPRLRHAIGGNRLRRRGILTLAPRSGLQPPPVLECCNGTGASGEAIRRKAIELFSALAPVVSLRRVFVTWFGRCHLLVPRRLSALYPNPVSGAVLILPCTLSLKRTCFV